MFFGAERTLSVVAEEMETVEYSPAICEPMRAHSCKFISSSQVYTLNMH